MEELIGLDIDKVIKLLITGILSLSTIIQISPIKINPWTYVANIIGRAINGELLMKIDKIDNEIEQLRNTTDERNAELLRSHILRFGDELLHGMRHSKEHFDQILNDITNYNAYCDTHKDFKNDMTKLTTEYIKDVYKECMDKHSFL